MLNVTLSRKSILEEVPLWFEHVSLSTLPQSWCVLERGNRNAAMYITNILEPHFVPFRPFIGMTLILCMIMVDCTLRE
jgi:hypothetical protein